MTPRFPRAIITDAAAGVLTMDIAYASRSRFLNACERAIRDAAELEAGGTVSIDLDVGGYAGGFWSPFVRRTGACLGPIGKLPMRWGSLRESRPPPQRYSTAVASVDSWLYILMARWRSAVSSAEIQAIHLPLWIAAMKIYIIHCSAKKDPVLRHCGRSLTPDKLYTATPTQRFSCGEVQTHQGELGNLLRPMRCLVTARRT